MPAPPRPSGVERNVVVTLWDWAKRVSTEKIMRKANRQIKGGDVILECVANLNTLLDYRYQQHFKAKKGGHGMGQNRTGAGGADVLLKLPPGTQVFEEDGETMIADLTKPGDRVVLLRGGNGGFGNMRFKSSTNQAPRRANPGPRDRPS